MQNKMIPPERKNILQKDSFKSLLSSLTAVLFGILAGAFLIFAVTFFNKAFTVKDASEGVKLIFFGIFNQGRGSDGELVFGFSKLNLGNMLFRATPIIMTGLSASFAFRSGIFNIGIPGQYLIGSAATLITALSIPQSIISPVTIWILAFLVGMIAGSLWGIIPGFFKAYLGVNEVLSSIMTNWIAANLVTMIFEISNFRNSKDSGKLGFILKTSENGVMTSKFGLDKIFEGSQLNAGIIISCIIAFLIYIIITKTTLGFELKTCGSNRFAAEYAGMNSKHLTILAMAISGALSGAGAALFYLSGNTEFFWSTYQSLPTEGFNGIPVALLALSNPIGVIFSGCFMSALTVSGQQLKTFTPYSENIINIVISVIVYLSAFSLILKNLFSKRNSKIKKSIAFPFNISKKEIISKERQRDI